MIFIYLFSPIRPSDYDYVVQKENRTPSVSHSKKIISTLKVDEESQSLKAFITPLRERKPSNHKGDSSSGKKKKSATASSSSSSALGGGLYMLSPYYFSPSRSTARPSRNSDAMQDAYEMSALK